MTDQTTVMIDAYIKKNGIHNYIADIMLASIDIIALRGIIYQWDKGWKSLDKYEIRKISREICTDQNGKYRNAIATEVKQIFEAVSQIALEKFNMYGNELIPFKNGYYNIKTKKLEALDKDKYFLYQFKHDYKPKAKCPIFREFLKQTIPIQKNREQFLQFLAYCFTTSVKLQKALLFYGREKTGKTTLMTLLRAIWVGVDTEIKLQELADKFKKKGLLGALLNISDDLPETELKDVGAIKDIITTDKITTDVKYEDPITFYNTTKHIFACNIIPNPQTKSGRAFYRRWIIVHCPNKVSEKNIDTDLDSKLAAEIPGIINYILEFVGMDKILEDQTKYISNLWLKYGDTAKYFIYKKCEYSDTYFTPKRELYNWYERYCNLNNREITNVITFGKKISEAGFAAKKKSYSGYMVHSYIGIKVKKSVMKEIKKEESNRDNIMTTVSIAPKRRGNVEEMMGEYE